jgi:pilus assembly protein CpaB
MVAAQPKKSRSSLGIIIFMTAAVICAGMAGLLLSYMMQQSYPQEPVKPVVVAAQAIPAGRPLVASDLAVAKWPQSSIPEGAHSTVEALIKVNAVPLTSLVKGEPVLARHLSRPKSGLGVAAKLKPGVRAMAVNTDASVTLARLLYPGARVDVLATLSRPGRGWEQDDNNVKTKVILQNVQVLAVGPEIDPLSATRPRRPQNQGTTLSGKNAAQNDGAERVVTVAVTARQSEKLVLASRQGKIDLVLRSPQDRQTLETPGATSVEVLGEQPPAPPRPQVQPVAQPQPMPKKRRRHRRRSSRRRVAAAEQQPAKPAGPEIYKVGVGRR